MGGKKNLAELAALLRRLVAFARSIGKFEIVRDPGSEEFKLRERREDTTGLLPANLMDT